MIKNKLFTIPSLLLVLFLSSCQSTPKVKPKKSSSEISPISELSSSLTSEISSGITSAPVTFILGVVISFLAGMACIKFLLSYIKKHDYNIFMWYRLLLALIVLIVLYLK